MEETPVKTIPVSISLNMCLTDLSYRKLRNLEKYWNIRKYYCVDLARCVWLMASWEILKNIEILENIPALISHKMCLTDGKLRCAIKIGSDSITELVPMHSRVRKMESQCDNYKYIWQIQIQIRLFITKHALELAKNGIWIAKMTLKHPHLG